MNDDGLFFTLGGRVGHLFVLFSRGKTKSKREEPFIFSKKVLSISKRKAKRDS